MYLHIIRTHTYYHIYSYTYIYIYTNVYIIVKGPWLFPHWQQMKSVPLMKLMLVPTKSEKGSQASKWNEGWSHHQTTAAPKLLWHLFWIDRDRMIPPTYPSLNRVPAASVDARFSALLHGRLSQQCKDMSHMWLIHTPLKGLLHCSPKRIIHLRFFMEPGNCKSTIGVGAKHGFFVK